MVFCTPIKRPVLLKFELFDMVAAKTLNSPLSVKCEEAVDRFLMPVLAPARAMSDVRDVTRRKAECVQHRRLYVQVK